MFQLLCWPAKDATASSVRPQPIAPQNRHSIGFYDPKTLVWRRGSIHSIKLDAFQLRDLSIFKQNSSSFRIHPVSSCVLAENSMLLNSTWGPSNPLSGDRFRTTHRPQPKRSVRDSTTRTGSLESQTPRCFWERAGGTMKYRCEPLGVCVYLDRHRAHGVLSVHLCTR